MSSRRLGIREVTPADCVLARKDADGASELWYFPDVLSLALLTFAVLDVRDDEANLNSGLNPSAKQ